MNQVERLYKIDQLLRKAPHSLQQLTELLEVSVATIKRDIEYMRDRLCAPIISDRSSHAYRLDMNAQHADRYVLPGLWFSEAEILALLTLQHLISQLEPSNILEHHIKPLSKRLDTLLSYSDQPVEKIRERILITGLGKRSLKTSCFEQAGFALIHQKQASITYHGRSKGDVTQRIVSPQRLVYYRANWYLDAWCHLREELRSFAIDGIEKIKMLDAPCKEIPIFVIKQTLGTGYGIFSGPTVQWATLRFTPTRARWVANEYWHEQQQGEFDDMGYYLLQIPYSDHRELMMDILKYGADCEVIAPQELRLQIIEQINKTKEIYR